MSVSHLIAFENDVFRTYVFWLTVLIIKTLLMAPLTRLSRYRNKVFANPEDAKRHNVKVKFDDPDVERVRRAHRNDLENVLPLLIVGFFYVLTDPSATLAINLIRIAAISRIVHSIVYAVWVLPQPSRGISFGVSLLITSYMAVHTLIYCL